MVELMKLLRTAVFALTQGTFLQNYKKMLFHLKYAYHQSKYENTSNENNTIMDIDL